MKYGCIISSVIQSAHSKNISYVQLVEQKAQDKDKLNTKVISNKRFSRLLSFRKEFWFHLYSEKTRQALVPPNPKLLDTVTLTCFCCDTRGM